MVGTPLPYAAPDRRLDGRTGASPSAGYDVRVASFGDLDPATVSEIIRDREEITA
jgi:hypothetical protein